MLILPSPRLGACARRRFGNGTATADTESASGDIDCPEDEREHVDGELRCSKCRGKRGKRDEGSTGWERGWSVERAPDILSALVRRSTQGKGSVEFDSVGVACLAVGRAVKPLPVDGAVRTHDVALANPRTLIRRSVGLPASPSGRTPSRPPRLDLLRCVADSRLVFNRGTALTSTRGGSCRTSRIGTSACDDCAACDARLTAAHARGREALLLGRREGRVGERGLRGAGRRRRARLLLRRLLRC